jgi:hypothetical protein
MTEYVYVPFKNDAGLNKMAAKWQGRVVLKHGGTRPLSLVNGNDTLYVTAHGRPGMRHAKGTQQQDQSRQQLSAKKLAERMRKDGLNTAHRTQVVLTICNGNKETFNESTFAEDVAKAASGYSCCWPFEAFHMTATVPGPSGKPHGKITSAKGNRGTVIIDSKYATRRIKSPQK